VFLRATGTAVVVDPSIDEQADGYAVTVDVPVCGMMVFTVVLLSMAGDRTRPSRGVISTPGAAFVGCCAPSLARLFGCRRSPSVVTTAQDEGLNPDHFTAAA
jgi:hypothetical protein